MGAGPVKLIIILLVGRMLPQGDIGNIVKRRRHHKAHISAACGFQTGRQLFFEIPGAGADVVGPCVEIVVVVPDRQMDRAAIVAFNLYPFGGIILNGLLATPASSIVMLVA